MLKMPRALTALAAVTISAGLLTVPTAAHAAPPAPTATITPTPGVATLNADGLVEVRFTAQVSLPESTPTFPVQVALTGGWGVSDVPVQPAGGTCSPAVLPAVGDYTITCSGQTDEAPYEDVVDILSRVSLSYPSQWGYPMQWTQTEVLTRYSASVVPPVVEPPVTEPPVVPPVVEPPVVEPPVVEPPVEAKTVECAYSVRRYRRTPQLGWFLNQTVKAGTPGRYCGTHLTDSAVFAKALNKKAARQDASKAAKAHRKGKEYLARGVHGWRYVVETVTCTLDTAGQVTTCESPKAAARSEQTIRVGRKGVRFARSTTLRSSNGQVKVTTP